MRKCLILMSKVQSQENLILLLTFRGEIYSTQDNKGLNEYYGYYGLYKTK